MKNVKERPSKKKTPVKVDPQLLKLLQQSLGVPEEEAENNKSSFTTSTGKNIIYLKLKKRRKVRKK